MTKIILFKKNNLTYGFEISGHTGFAEIGKDIVCASISSISQSVIMGILNVLKIKAVVKKDEKKGFLKIELPKNLDPILIQKAQILFDTFEVSIKDLMTGYSNYIKLEEREYDY